MKKIIILVLIIFLMYPSFCFAKDISTKGISIKYISQEEIIDSPYYEQYEKAMMLDRNTDWVKDIKKYIDAGGTTFIFTGAAHWLGEESVFELLKADGVIEK